MTELELLTEDRDKLRDSLREIYELTCEPEIRDVAKSSLTDSAVRERTIRVSRREREITS